MPFPSGPSYPAYANYMIVFADEEEYNNAIMFAGGSIIDMCPANAATVFGMPWPQPAIEIGITPKYMYVIGSPWYILDEPGSQVMHPGPSGVYLSPSVDYVIVPGQAGVPASIWPAGPDMVLSWSGIISRGSGVQGDPEAINGIIAERMFINGFEFAPNAEGGTNNNLQCCRDASRVIDGTGYAIRQGTNTTASYQLAEFGAAASTSSWERIYIRLRTIDTDTPVQIYQSANSISSGNGSALWLNNDILELWDVAATLTHVNIIGSSTIPLVLNKWHQIDILLEQSPAASIGPPSAARFRLYIDKVLAIDGLALTGGIFPGFSQAGVNHQQSTFGIINSPANTWEFDLDDWICAVLPDTEAGLDFLMGSHIRKLYIEDFGVGMSGWAGQYDSMNQMINPTDVSVGSKLTSSTPSARLEGLTDEGLDLDFTGINFGPVAALLAIHGFHGGVQDSKLGYSINGAISALVIANLSSLTFAKMMYRPSGMTLPDIISPFNLIFDKSTGIDLATINAFQAIVEYIGTWGLEDDPMGIEIPPAVIHNCHYANSIWGFAGPIPDGPVDAIGGTYVGNDTFQSIDLPSPCHFLWIRPIGVAVAPMIWFGANLGGHFGGTDTIRPESLVRMRMDINGQVKFTVVGTDNHTNANGVTYQYIAFCDPGMRFNLCGAYCHSNLLATAANPLIDADFEADGGFIQTELQANTSNESLAYKGPGHGGDTALTLQGGALANFGSFAAGILNTRVDSHLVNSEQGSYSLWRTTDSNGGVMCQILSYIGNGVSPRVIPLTPISERFPLFALVMPAAAIAIYRDPSHTGTTSTTTGGAANAASGITAGGVDTITVGSSLNVNGVVYEVFVIPGDADGWTNGGYHPPNGPPSPGPFPKPPTTPSDIGITGSGGIVFGGDTATLLLKDKSGIYTLIKDKTQDTLYDRQTLQTNVDVKIPNPIAKTGFIGG